MVQYDYIMNYISKEEIVDKLNVFYKENGYFPTKLEIEECDYLPSPMSIYRKIGSLNEVRELLKMKPKASFREKNMTALQTEIDKVYKFLNKYFPEADIQKKVNIEEVGNVHVSLLLPNSSEPVYIHFFSAKTVNSLGYTVRTLQRRYEKTENQVVLVCMKTLNQKSIQNYIENRKKWLPDHIRVLSSRYFKKYIEDTLKIKYNENMAK